MTNLSFETGTYKEYSLNGGETIRINVGDWNIVNRLKEAGKRIDQIIAALGSEPTDEDLVRCDKQVRDEIDSAIICPGACDKAFGQISSIGIAENGSPVGLNFLSALIDQLAKDMKQTVTTSEINGSVQNNPLDELDNERTQKYITQSKPQIVKPSESVQSLNLATLTQEERSRLLAELLGESK